MYRFFTCLPCGSGVRNALPGKGFWQSNGVPFGIFLCVLLVSSVNIVLKTVFTRFWIACGSQNHQKPSVFVGEIEDARFCAVISLGVAIRSSLAPFWDPKSDQNRLREGSEIDPKYDRKKCCVWDRFLEDFGSQLRGPRGSKDSGFRSRVGPGATLAPTIPPSSLRDRIFVDLG